MHPVKKLSLVGTAFNEEGNIEEFCRRADAALAGTGLEYEIIIVDDGSTDATFDKLAALKTSLPRLKIVSLQRNFGQTAALDAGFAEASGDAVFVFDTDLQQDPAIVSILLAKLHEGADVVSGKRVKRQHAAIYRFMAWFGFLLRKFILGIPVRDTACSPNAYRAEILKDLNLHGEMHRFLVPIFYWRGFRVEEVDVPHHKRGSGTTKYSIFKSVRAFLDFLVIKFWMGYSVKPMHLFGGTGFFIAGVGFLVGVYVIIARSLDNDALVGSTVPLFSVLLMLMGTQLVFFGVMADILMRVYYGAHPTYFVKRKI